MKISDNKIPSRNSEIGDNTNVETPINKLFLAENLIFDDKSYFFSRDGKMYFDGNQLKDQVQALKFSKFLEFDLEENSNSLDICRSQEDVNFQVPTQSMLVTFSEVNAKHLQTQQIISEISKTQNPSENKEALQSSVSKSRKWGRDSFHKKIKCMFLKYVVSFFQTKLDLTFVQKLSQKLVTNVTKKYNRDLLNTDLETFGINHLGLSKAEYSQRITEIDFKGCTLARLYQEYLNSVNFEMDLKRISEKENEMYISALKEYINDFIRYYCQTKNSKN